MVDRKGKFRLIIVILFTIVAHWTFGQCPVANFSISPTVCINQQTLISNTSSSAVLYDWDFCSGDLSKMPTASELFNIDATNGSFKGDLVQSNGSIFYFFTSRVTGKLYRLDYGNNINSSPVFIDLGQLGIPNSGGLLAVQIVNDGGIYYGFVIDFFGKLYRFQLGSSVINNPSDAELIYQNNSLNLIDLDILFDGNERFAFIASFNTNKITRIKFQSSFGEPTTNFSVDDIVVTGSGNLSGLSFLKECNVWYAAVTSSGGNQLTKIFFDSGLTDVTPTFSGVTGLGFPLSSAGGVSLVVEGGKYYAFVQAQRTQSNLYRINFGNSLANSSPTGNDLSDLGILSDVFGFSMHKVNSDWLVLAHQNTGRKIFKIVFPESCFSDTKTSAVASPSIHFTNNGTQTISLRAIDAQGNESFKSMDVVISVQTAPTIDFATQNKCVNNNVLFLPSSTDVINSYQWDFGNSQSSNQPSPVNIYSSSGTYAISLNVVGANACQNFVQKSISIYNAPVANFDLPASPLICTNQDYVLANTSTSDVGSNPSWEWTLNGNLVSTQQNFITRLTSTSPENIKLKVTLPGCSNEITKIINGIVVGPAVDFSAEDNCKGTPVAFNNTTVGTVTGFTWDFGDGSTSTQSNISHTYSTSATFQIMLTATNAAGCQNFSKKIIKIYSLPVPDFSIGLPPFSCSNSATPFQNITPALTDSNITSWAWQFGDNVGTSSSQSPSYTYSAGNTYLVGLTAKSDKGCSVSVTKSISIAAGPVPDFSVGPACLNQSAKFTDLSSGGVQMRSWQIASTAFNTPNPAYTFITPGDFLATLTVTTANSCSSFKTKTVNVPVPPALNFNSINLCAGQSAQFVDVTPSQQDAIVGWNWNFAGNSSTGNPADFSFNTSGTYTVKLMTTHSSGCKYILSKNVLVNTSPIANFTVTRDRGSAPLIVQFVNTSQFADSYTWNFYDKIVSSSTQASPSYTFVSLGDYSAELIAKNQQGCSDKKTIPIKVLVPSIDLQLTDFTLTPDPTTGKLKGIVTIFNNSNISIMSTEVSLILADKAIVNETLQMNLDPGQSVSKTLSFTISPNQFDFNYLCAKIISEKDILQSNNKRCINLETTDYFFNPYPNPTAGTLHVDWISVTSAPAHIMIHDNMGKRCYDWQTISTSGLNQAQLDLTFLISGFYYLSIETIGSKKTSRFFRE